MKFGDKLTLLREQKGLSVSEVADRIGVSENAVAYYEKNVRKPRSKSTLDALAQLFDCTVEELTDDSIDISPKLLTKQDPEKESDKAVRDKTEPETTASVVEVEPEATASAVDAEPEPMPSAVDNRPETTTSVVDTEPEPMPSAVDTRPETTTAVVDAVPEPTVAVSDSVPKPTASAVKPELTAKVTVEKFSVNPDKYFNVGKKKKIRIGKKAAKVSVSDKSIAKVRIKGKKITVKGKKAGTVRITAYSKKGNVLGNWVIHLKGC